MEKKSKYKVQFVGTPLLTVQENPTVIEWPRTVTHYHTYGLLSKFFLGLKKRKLFVTYCPNPRCEEKRLWLPPRADCPDCHAGMRWTQLPNPVIGKVFTFTKVEYAGTGIELSLPYYQIDVRIPGLATIPKGYLLYGEPCIGMKVKAGFRTKNPTNTILDLYWTPLEKKGKNK